MLEGCDNGVLTRWDEWYAPGNLAEDPRILAAPPSQCARTAAAEFLARGKRRVLDLACGVGRDTFDLEARGLAVVGTDASPNGLRAAARAQAQRGTAVPFIVADARVLPFADQAFEGVYCFGLLHEFAGADRQHDVARVMAEIGRVLRGDGLLVLAVAAGDPQAGLPAVQLFTREMFERAAQGWRPIEISLCDDVGCTNRTDYHVWYGAFER